MEEQRCGGQKRYEVVITKASAKAKLHVHRIFIHRTAYKRENDFFLDFLGTVRVFSCRKTVHITVCPWFDFTRYILLLGATQLYLPNKISSPNWPASSSDSLKTLTQAFCQAFCVLLFLFIWDAREWSRLFTDLLLQEAHSRPKLLTTFRMLLK